MKNTKIIATIGPASMDKIADLISNGADAIRINTAHGDFDQYLKIIKELRKSSHVPVILDIKGPEIRIKVKKELEVEQDDVLEMGFSSERDVWLTSNISKDVREGHKLLICDGKIRSEIIEVKEESIKVKFLSKGTLQNNKNANVPGAKLNLPSLSEKDLRSIDFAKENDVDFIALSFVRNKEDILSLKKLAGKGMGIISKLENQQGIDNLDEIIKESDAVMVARGDLGVEIEPEKLPMLQKNVISRCNSSGKPVIIATQMLLSMVSSPNPTRAEASDVANAILDGADCVMLSDETASGSYPMESVRMMAEIAKETEPYVKPREMMDEKETSSIVASAVYNIFKKTPNSKLVAITYSGHSSLMMARYRVPLIAVSKDESVCRRLSIAYGILPIFFPDLPLRNKAVLVGKFLFGKGLLTEKDTVIFIGGTIGAEKHRKSNMILVNEMKYLLQES